FGATVELANRNHAIVVGLTELGDYLTTTKNVENVSPMGFGGKAVFDFGSIVFVQAFQGYSLTDDTGIPDYLCVLMGLILEIEGKTIYHTGDTGLFGDMKLIAERHPVDICFIPIGDNFTMGIDDASFAINQFIKPKITVPIHYNTFDLIKQNPEDFKSAVSEGEVQILNPGDAVQL